MERNFARELPIYSAVHIHDEIPQEKIPKRMIRDDKMRKFKRDYAIVIVLAAAFTVYTILLCWIVNVRTERRVRQEMAIEYASQLERYKAELKEQEQASHWLSGDASREAAINQEVDAVASVISKLSTDAQKLTEASCMLARVMSTAYPNSFAEVASQVSQWMFYDGKDNTFSQHDRALAESIVRPYMEEGIVPNGLTDKLVYGEWTPNDFVLRDSYKTTSLMHTWRYGA